ncbi:MAG: serpin family protein [Lachnospirales bacterium]
MKKFLSIFIAVLTMFTNVYAYDAEIRVDGKTISTPAQVIDSISYVPIRNVFEEIDCKVEWDNITKTCSILYNEDRIYFNSNDKDIKIIENKMYVPLKKVMDTFGININWDTYSKSIDINTIEIDPPSLDEPEEVTFPESFDYKLNKLMPKDKNYMFSPISIKYAMAMVANGADEETKKEICNTLEIGNIDSFNNEVKEYLEGINSDNEISPEFRIANGIWFNESNFNGGDFSDSFKKIIENYFIGTAKKVTNDNAVSTINNWCADNTNNKINSILSSSEFLSCITNAVYFKGTWRCQFDEDDTKSDIFTDKNGNNVETEFMKITEEFDFYEDENIKLISMPYVGSSISMYIGLGDKNFENYIDKMTLEKVNVKIPKFKFEYSDNITDKLINMGMTSVFDTNENKLNKMFKNVDINTYISKVLHKTYIDVNEKGTEAAAVTITLTGSMAMDESEKIYDFIADKPFTFFIRDNESKEILFMGEYSFVE